ncbi:hypothetical protein A9Q86_12525 [Flavobacteriales bacterium 33_180_T64]|nr:hypothetical protein A9Q86_12525 [Flavobacteriales bacterium 33_180_T64]
MKKIITHKTLMLLIVSVWFINGLFCKVLHFVPRHEEIVSRILGNTYSSPFTVFIGILEILMAIWIVSGYKSKLNAALQIIIIALMNILEYIHVPDLLLWGKSNILFAILFICIVYYTNFKYYRNHVSNS